MTQQRYITIGPEFFSKARNDYSDWRWAIAREFMQNSMDARASNIDVTIVEKADGVMLQVSNDGESMTKAILTEKLLSLGASGKSFRGTTGGFGKAKEILYFCHESYVIRTGNMLVKGSGASYTLDENAALMNGTTSAVIIKECTAESLKQEFKRFCGMMTWQGSVTINGEKVTQRMPAARTRRNLAWARVRTNRAYQNRLVLRIGGMPMMSRYISYDRCVIVDIAEHLASKEVLTSNRDWLRTEYAGQLNAFVDELTVDKNTALHDKTPSYRRFYGSKLTAQAKSKGANVLLQAYATLPTTSGDDDDDVADEYRTSDREPALAARTATATHQDAGCSGGMGFEFIVKNTTALEIPTYYLPYDDGSMGSYGRKIITVWAKCLIMLHELFNDRKEFSVGWVFDEDNEAEHDRTTEWGTLFLLNPAVVVTQQKSNSRSLKKRWKLNHAGRHAILSVAVHEYVHSLGFSAHDASYSNKLTDVTGAVMANLRKFAACFR